MFKTLPKAQQTRGLSSGYQSNFFRSFHKFSKKILITFHLHLLSSNFNQISALRLNLNFEILTKRCFRISTKNNLHKLRLNFSFKISPELQLQNLDQTLCSKSGRKFDFMTKLQLPNLHQTVVKTVLSISNSNNLNKF